ncbi:MAG TPA: phosphoribosylanthranilate isomerase [Candidatus Dormibacteraeota bacterium]|jgi:phosphoribosylanthranilate isomerase|nr:phosphoribosylanthranilate isomerase [Candidatus Dormibacteraeota bacterium]
MTRIKICGNTRAEDVELALSVGVDLLGFIFTRSKRQISITEGAALVADIPESVERVGVFIDEPPAVIAQAIDRCRLTAAQIYRPITAEDRRLGVALLPALRMRPGLGPVDHGVLPSDRIVLDTWTDESDGGGSGRTWDWGVAEALARQHRVIVSGGLNAANVDQAVATLAPWGVDVCGGVESAARQKDPAKLRAFVAAVRGADR